MPSDPRLNFFYDEDDAHMTSVPADGTINLPTLVAGGYVPSTAFGLAVAFVQAGQTAPQIGLGAAGNEVAGIIKQVESDGSVTIQDRGIALVPFVVGTPPTLNNPVGVDGTGKVQLQAGNKKAVCIGYQNDFRVAGSPLKCLIRIF